jgi:hypothetical protein
MKIKLAPLESAGLRATEGGEETREMDQEIDEENPFTGTEKDLIDSILDWNPGRTDETAEMMSW